MATRITATQRPCLIDSDVLIDFLRGNASAQTAFKKLPDDCAVSAITVAELHAGVREGAERVALDTLLATFSVIGLDAPLAALGGLLRRDWGRSHGVGLNDALIAATARVTGRVLWTLNEKHFPMLEKTQRRVPYVKD